MLRKSTTFFLLTLLAISVAEGVSYFKLPGGKSVTVVNQSTAERIRDEANQNGVMINEYDPMSGVMIVESKDAKSYTISPQIDLVPASVLNDEHGKKVAIVVGIERESYNNKVLPFGYYRVQKLDGERLKSGALLFNTDNELVAIYYNDHQENLEHGYAAPVKAALRGHTDYVTNNEISRSWVGILTSPTGGVPEVTSVRPDSPGADQGIKKGDIILKVGEFSVSTYHEAVNAFYYLIPGTAEQFTVLQDTEIKTFTVTPVSRNSHYQKDSK